MWPFKVNVGAKRQKALTMTDAPVMQAFLSSPVADKKTDWREMDIVAVDLETTGLDPQTDQILSIGLVEIKQGSIHLNSAWHKVVNVGSDIPESTAIIHHITDDVIAEGESLAEILPELLKRLSGKVMLVHYAYVEQEFINSACLKMYNAPFVIQTIDTLPIAQRRLERRNHTIQPGNLRLFNLRRYYNLPDYKAHNALYDALATAELFMAMTTEIAPSGKQKLGDYLN